MSTFQETFEKFMSQLVDTNATLDYYSDFEKVFANVDAVSMKLHQLNFLVGRADFENAVRCLWNENPAAFDVLEILLAVRSSDHKKAIDRSGRIRLLSDFFTTADGVIEYLEDSGLKQVFCEKRVTNLVDYVFGVETGLDTNARKNRGGHLMERCVANVFRTNGICFRSEVRSSEFDELSCLGDDIKRFDFVIQQPTITFLIEVNFYSSGGSKLNEVARAYTEIAKKINHLPNYEFVWITDGQGWKSARNKLEEAYRAIPSVYNLTTIHDFVSRIKKIPS